MSETDTEIGLPLAYEDAEGEFHCTYNWGLHDALQKVYAERNIYFQLLQCDTGVGMGTNFPAPNAAAIKGKKIRAPGVWGEYVTALGGSPVSLAQADLYMAMKLGTIDGWMTGPLPLKIAS